jgi:hypothetical protein
MISTLSPKALVALMAGATGKVRMTKPGLMEAFPGFGRDYWGGALKELEDSGMVKRGSYQAGKNKQWNHYEDITDLGWMYIRDWLPPSDNPSTEWVAAVGKPVVLLSENQLINPNNITSITSKEVTREDPRNENKTFNISVEEKEMPYQFFNANESEDEYTQEAKEERRKYRDAKMQDSQTKFVSTKRAKLGSRHDLVVEKWGSNEIAYEFMDRLTRYFHIKNNITVRRITGAFAKMRMVHQTNGEIEYKMLDLFFETTKFEKYDDGEHMWKLFITRSPELAVQAKRMVQTSEEKETSALQAAKSQEWLSE